MQRIAKIRFLVGYSLLVNEVSLFLDYYLHWKYIFFNRSHIQIYQY